MGGCFPCLGSPKGGEGEEKKKEFSKEGSGAASSDAARGNLEKSKSRGAPDSKKEPPPSKDGPSSKIAAQTFQFRELAAATQNFRPECLLGEGGFGRVYKGRLESSGQVVAVKQLDRNGLQGNREFLVEVLMLSLLHHPNLVSLIGYCADGDQRLLVYEFMPLGSLEDHLHAGMTDSSMADFIPIAAFTLYNALHASLPLICGPSQKQSRDACNIPLDKEPLDWITRMKIAAGAAKGLEYLHDKANPPVIYRDLKSSNILLGEGFHPKLSDFGLAKLGPVGDKTHVSTRVMGTYGYCAPEYAMTGQLTLKSDVYSFGVVLLEIITGRKAIDNARVTGEQNLVAWARPLFKDRRKFPKMADPLLEGRFPMRGLYQALAVAAMCLQEQATTRPLIADVVTALQYLASQTYDPNANPSSNRNRVGPSTKDWNDQKSLAGGSETQEDSGSNGRDRGVNSPRLDMLRQKEYVRGLSIGAEVGRGESGRGSGRKGNLDEMERPQSQRNSPVHAVKQRDSPKHLGRDKDREQAIAEARQWGENWRERKRTAAECSLGDTNK